jgi:putative DNA primase/helicase
MESVTLLDIAASEEFEGNVIDLFKRCPWCFYPGHIGNCVVNLHKVVEALPPHENDWTEQERDVMAALEKTATAKGLPSFDHDYQNLLYVEPELVNWLWPGRIPFGSFTIIDGDPGLGKSAMTIDIAACVTTGRAWPDGTPGGSPAAVILLTAEDGIADTVRPRAMAAGADVARITIIEEVFAIKGWPNSKNQEVVTRIPSIPDDLPRLEAIIRETNAVLVIIDPLSAYYGAEVDANSDPKVRRALAPLAKMAERTGCAVILVRHLTKNTDRTALYRGGGSVGIIAAARAGFVVAQDPEGGDNDRVIAPTKFNLGPRPDALKFATVGRTISTRTGQEIATVAIDWRGRSLLSADSLLGPPENPEQLQAALDFLTDLLTGYRVAAAVVYEKAKAADISVKTLQRAKAKLGIISVKSSMVEGWLWHLPGDEISEGGQARP